MQQFFEVTRKWCKTDGNDTTLNLTRELVRNRLRIQSFEIDPYVRGRSVYHRHGNIVGNGLIRCAVRCRGTADGAASNTPRRRTARNTRVRAAHASL